MNNVQKRVSKVLQNMARMAEQDNEYAVWFSEDLEVNLNHLLDEDAFGTEGQNDPRGDMRDGRWDMYCVQGIDECP